MGPRRYSRDRNVRRRQEQFEELQWRCDVDYYTPTIRELREAGIASLPVRPIRQICVRIWGR
jgi:hypothetical protein